MMADWRSMEPVAPQSWVPCDYPMTADWTMEPAAQVWVPSLPVEYQTSPLATSGQQQLVVEYAAPAAASEEDQFDDGGAHTIIHDEVEVKIHDDAIHVFKEVAQVFDSDIKKMGVKMHRYPISLNQYRDSKRHSVPSTVAIGPYYHGLLHLQEAEKVKHVAAYHCIEQSGHLVQYMYGAVVLDTDHARSLYDKKFMVRISDDDFQPMMFYDACFLVQYMLSCTLDGYRNMDKSLRSYFDANGEAIFNDVMMLENQLPWQVVETLVRFRNVPLNLEHVVAYARGYLQDCMDLKNPEPVTLDHSYKPPHLLGFLRFYMVGRGKRSDINNNDTKQSDLLDSISFSVSAIELAEMGINIKVSKTKELMDIGIEEGQHDLFLPQVSLDDSRACILVNMAAFELCTIPDFRDAEEEDSAVCSYLQLLAMVLDKVEDVQELRRKRVLQGGGGLTNKQVLDFFNRLQDLRHGSRYISTMLWIENYKRDNKLRVWWKTFFYNHWKTIAKVFTFIATLVGIFVPFLSISFKKSN